MTNKPLLITGSAGFFGDILKKQLLTQGYTCVGLDLHKDDYSHSNLVTVQGDIRDRKLVSLLFNQHKFGAVFHCAAMLAHDIPDKNLLWESNVEGTRNIANTAIESGVSKLIFTSSNCLWANNFGRPVQERDIPNPVEIYGRSKLEAENLLLDCSNNLDVIILRCPTIIDEGRLGLLAILFELIDEGWYQGNIADAAYDFEKKINAGRRIVVGVNDFTEGNEEEEMCVDSNEWCSEVGDGVEVWSIRIGVQSGTTSDTYAAAELANAEVSAFGLPQKFQRLDRLRVP